MHFPGPSRGFPSRDSPRTLPSLPMCTPSPRRLPTLPQGRGNVPPPVFRDRGPHLLPDVTVINMAAGGRRQMWGL